MHKPQNPDPAKNIQIGPNQFFNVGNKWTVETVTSFAVAGEDRPHFMHEEMQQLLPLEEEYIEQIRDFIDMWEEHPGFKRGKIFVDQNGLMNGWVETI